MASVTINEHQVEIADGERLNMVQAASRAGIEVPHYCWHPALTVVASCRMCLVEAGERKPDGTVQMQPRLVPACQMPARDGTVIVTNSEKVKQAQAATLEYLLLNHPLDCPTCDQAGECWLQDYSYRFGRSYSRLREPKVQRPDKPHIGDQITLFTDRCIMCTRCVRFTREISGTGELQVINRGTWSEIDIFPGKPCNNKLAGNVVDLCPVGALCSKDFLYKQRVWWLQTRDSVCPNCSTGCSIYVEQSNERVYRLRPRPNPDAQGHFMCDEGRFGFKYIHDGRRHLRPIVRDGSAARGPAATSASTNGDGLPLPPDWSGILSGVRKRILEQADRDASAIAAVLSPWMTVEEAWLLAGWLRSVSPRVRLAMAPAAVVGEDDHYPKDWKGDPVLPPKFTIRAEKCPNRPGVGAVLAHFNQGNGTGFDKLLDDVRGGRIQILYAVHPGPDGWLPDDGVSALAGVPYLIVQDLLQSPLSDAAQVVLPGALFAEKDGTFVNHAGLAQKIVRSVRCPAEGYTDARIFMELAGRSGMFNARLLRQEIAANVPFFAPLATGDPGQQGIRLLEMAPVGEAAAR